MKSIYSVFLLLFVATYSFSQYLPVPANLNAKSEIDSPSVYLSWYNSSVSNWFQYIDSVDSKYYGGNINFFAGIKLDSLQLKEYVGSRISQIAIVPANATTGYQVEIYEIYSDYYYKRIMVQGFDELIYNDWSYLEAIDDIYIEAGKTYIVGYNCTNVSSTSAGYSTNGVKPGYSDILKTGGVFRSLSDENLEGSWNIKLFIESAAGDTAPVLDYYNIYRNDGYIGQSQSSNYTDSLLTDGLFKYNVSAIYSEQESELSAPAEVIYDTKRIRKNTIVFEEFTNTECPNCPGAANGVRDMVNYGYDVAPIALHDPFYSDLDPFANADAGERKKYYSGIVTGFPTTIIGGNRYFPGGTYTGSNFNYFEPIYLEAIAEKTPLGMDGFLYQELDGNYGISINVIPVGIYPDSVIDLHVVLTEDIIDYSWQTVGDVEYVHRDNLTSVDGEMLKIMADSDIDYQLKYALPDVDLRDHYEVIAFVQNKKSKEILNGLYLKMHEMEYRNHEFTVTQKGEPLQNTLIEIGVNALVTDNTGKASFNEFYYLDSIPFTVKMGNDLLHSGYFGPNDSIIVLEVGGTDIINDQMKAIKLYPNPANENITVLNASHSTINFYNIAGAIVKTAILTSNASTIQVGDLPAGIYFVRVNYNSGGFYVQKLLIE